MINSNGVDADFAVIKVGVADTHTTVDGLALPYCDAVEIWDLGSDAPQYDACANLATGWSTRWGGFLCAGHRRALAPCREYRT